jgi:uncharacterized lipoprotein YddW (UPF0748 family)
MRRVRLVVILSVLAVIGLLAIANFVASGASNIFFLPLVLEPEPTPTPTPTPPPPTAEFRGLWVTRFDWTDYGQPADPSRIDEIVNNAAYAGFNAIFFQVRGTADAYYKPGPEPWAQRVSGGVLGQPPDSRWIGKGGDPLAYFIQQAHARGIELHAYINVYPVWDCGSLPPAVSPQHFYYQLQNYHGSTVGKNNGLQWDTAYNVDCHTYQRATPASVFADLHYLEVGRYLADNYDIDGLHLDHIRYGAVHSSCDPVSAQASGVSCFQTPANYSSYAAWQRAQVNGTVRKFYDEIIRSHPDLILSAAVWPIYINYWGWPGNPQQGYHDYYQDSKAWIQGDYIDSISPMIYGSGFWTQQVWQTLVADFQASSGGRFVVPGIGAAFDSFSEIETRIAMARSIGTAGHAIFSYGAMRDHGYFDDLANGPYSEPAVVPEISWGR